MTTILETIRKLLTLAQNAGALPGEVEAALNRAAHLQRTHGITDEQIRSHLSQTTDGTIFIDPKAVRTKVILTCGRVGRWQSWCASAAARAVGCGIYFTSRVGAAQIIAYGLPADLEVCFALFEFALAQLDKSAKAFCKANRVPMVSEGKAYRDGFCHGLIDAAMRAAAEAATSTEPVEVKVNAPAGVLTGALVVVAESRALTLAKGMAVDTYRKGLRLRAAKGSYRPSSGSWDSKQAGQADGERTNMSRRVIQ